MTHCYSTQQKYCRVGCRAKQEEQEHFQMLSDITSKNYITLERCKIQKQLAEKFIINRLYGRRSRRAKKWQQ